jgi:hypothetical protein
MRPYKQHTLFEQTDSGGCIKVWDSAQLNSSSIAQDLHMATTDGQTAAMWSGAEYDEVYDGLVSGDLPDNARRGSIQQQTPVPQAPRPPGNDRQEPAVPFDLVDVLGDIANTIQTLGEASEELMKFNWQGPLLYIELADFQQKVAECRQPIFTCLQKICTLLRQLQAQHNAAIPAATKRPRNAITMIVQPLLRLMEGLDFQDDVFHGMAELYMSIVINQAPNTTDPLQFLTHMRERHSMYEKAVAERINMVMSHEIAELLEQLADWINTFKKGEWKQLTLQLQGLFDVPSDTHTTSAA